MAPPLCTASVNAPFPLGAVGDDVWYGAAGHEGVQVTLRLEALQEVQAQLHDVDAQGHRLLDLGYAALHAACGDAGGDEAAAAACPGNTGAAAHGHLPCAMCVADAGLGR